MSKILDFDCLVVEMEVIKSNKQFFQLANGTAQHCICTDVQISNLKILQYQYTCETEHVHLGECFIKNAPVKTIMWMKLNILIQRIQLSFVSGLMMMPASVLAYFQLGQFLMLVMVFSWLYSTFCFLSICSVIGPKDNFGQLSISRVFRRCGLCRVKPEEPQEPAEKSELEMVLPENQHVISDPEITTTL